MWSARVRGARTVGPVCFTSRHTSWQILRGHNIKSARVLRWAPARLPSTTAHGVPPCLMAAVVPGRLCALHRHSVLRGSELMHGLLAMWSSHLTFPDSASSSTQLVHIASSRIVSQSIGGRRRRRLGRPQRSRVPRRPHVQHLRGAPSVRRLWIRRRLLPVPDVRVARLRLRR